MADMLRTYAREAYAMRGISGQAARESLPYLLEEAGELARAVRDADADAVLREVADVAVVLDHILEFGRDEIGPAPTLAAAVTVKVTEDRARFGVSGDG